MIDELLARVRSECGSFPHDKVQHAWDAEPIDATRDTVPLLYAWIGSESTADDGSNDVVSKRLEKMAHVVCVCKIEDLEAIKTETRRALLGWNPDASAGYDDLQLVGGDTIKLKGGIVWWQDNYTTWLTLREVYE